MINVCFITDKNYVIPTLTAVKSLIINAKSNVNISVVSTGLSNRFINLFEKLSTEYCSVKFIKAENPGKKIHTDHQHVSKEAMLKFALPNIFPDLDKVLYLDSDILVLDDLEELYTLDLKDNYAAAVADFMGMKQRHHEKFGFNKYFNSGVMLLNLKLMRENDMTNTLIKNKLNDRFLHFMDQDALNQSFAEKVLWISPKYNLMKPNLCYEHDEIAEAYNLTLSEFEIIYNYPTILHLTNKIKPWNSTETEGAEQWYKYFNKLPFERNILSKKILLFILKHLTVFSKFFNIKQEDKRIKISLLGIKFSFKQKKILKNKLIVSLTSYPARMQYVPIVIRSLLKQSKLPDKIVLWLTYEEFPNGIKDVPQELLDIQTSEPRFEIDWCHNEMCFNKLIPALKKYPDDIIITVDDDILYERDRIEILCREYLKHPQNIICHRAHYVTLDKNRKLRSYNDWHFEYKGYGASFNHFLTGVGMVLYPPKIFYKDILDDSIYKKLTPANDDIWFWAMALINNVKIRLAKKHYNTLPFVENSQEVGLCYENCNNRRNDTFLKQVLDYYPQIYKKLRKDKPINIADLFSIKNDGKHKVIKFLGLKLKLKMC